MLVLAAGSMTGLAQQLQTKSLTHEAILRGQSIAVNLALSSGDDLLSKLYFRIVPLALRAKTDNDLVYAAVLNQENVIVGHADPERIDKPFKLEGVKAVGGLDVNSDVVEGIVDGVRVWDISVPVKPAGVNRAIGVVHIGMAISKVESAVAESRNNLLQASAMILFVGLLVTWLALRVLVRPLDEMAKAAAQVGQGDLQVSVPVRSRDEIGRMAENFNAMVSNLSLAEKVKLEKERMQSELDLGRSIQEGLLPKNSPQQGGMEMAFHCQPAKELGGDLYDWFEIQGGKKIAFLIADVSGKGIPAALHMTNLRNLFRFIAADEPSPVEVLKKVNKLAYPDFRGEHFVTLIYAVLDIRSGEMILANAGHDPAYIRRASGGEIVAIDSTSLPIGLADSEDFDSDAHEKKISIRRGDLVFLFTDGVTEAMNVQDEQFGLERLQEILQTGGDAAGVVENVIRAVKDHANGFEQSDDLTVLALLAGNVGKP